jgi:simple sugar transport system ATP-binding protein
MESLMKLENVSRNFGAIRALQNIDFEIQPGEIVGLVGDNGAGKSTLIKLICGIFPPSSGSIYFEGKKVSSFNSHISRELGIQAVHQGFGLVDLMSIERNLVLGEEPRKNFLFFRFLDREMMKEMTKKMIKTIDIKRKLEPSFVVGQLSGGEKQTIKIGRSISYEDRLLVLDEPITGLSVRETHNVLELITRLKQTNVAVIFITHDFYQVYPIADRIVILDRGMKILDVPKAAKQPQEIIGIIRNPEILNSSKSMTENHGE